MDKKAQIGMLVIVAAAIIVGAVLMTALGNQSASVTTTNTITNASYKSNAIPNGTITLAGQGFQGTVTIQNGTGKSTNINSQFSVSNDGGIIIMKTLDTAVPYNNGTLLNVSYIQEPVGYADATTRSIVPLILIFFALAIAAVALWPVIQNLRESI